MTDSECKSEKIDEEEPSKDQSIAVDDHERIGGFLNRGHNSKTMKEKFVNKFS